MHNVTANILPKSFDSNLRAAERHASKSRSFKHPLAGWGGILDQSRNSHKNEGISET